MKKYAYVVGALLCVGSSSGVAQQTYSTSRAASPGSDDDFTVGLRRIGVLAGQSVICAPEATRSLEIDKVVEAGNMIANEFGLRAAFNFIGAAGYGSGHPFDKTTCCGAIKGWTDVQKKYGEQ